MSLISGVEKFYASEGCHNFQSKVFCLTVPKNFEEEPFCAVFQKISGSEKVYGSEWGEGGWQYHDFPSEVFLSQGQNFL